MSAPIDPRISDALRLGAAEFGRIAELLDGMMVPRDLGEGRLSASQRLEAFIEAHKALLIQRVKP